MTLVLQLSGLINGAVIMRQHSHKLGFGSENGSYSEPKHAQLFTLLTGGSVQGYSVGHNLLKSRGTDCFSAIFSLYLQSLFFGWVFFVIVS